MHSLNTTVHPLPYRFYRQAIETETVRFAEVIRGVDPATPVPSCPSWTLADLTRHVGAVQRWFCALLTQRITEPPRTREVELGLPDSEEHYADWIAGGIPRVVEVLDHADPEAPMWAWGPDQHARFWARRMFFETLVHRADAELAAGQAPVVDAMPAGDGVHEFLVNLPSAELFAPGVGKLRGVGEVIEFRSTDAAQETWRVRLDPDGFALEPRTATDAAAPPAQATIESRAADLLMLVYGRLSHDDAAFSVSGDRQLLDRWFTHSAF